MRELVAEVGAPSQPLATKADRQVSQPVMAPRRQRILVVQPSLGPSGGGHTLAAWALQALVADHDVTLLVADPPDCDRINAYCGTSLRPTGMHVERLSLPWRAMTAAMPTPARLLIAAALHRRCRQLDRRQPYDVLLSTCNEADLGRRGIQYLHDATAFQPAPPTEQRWYHGFPGAAAAYRWLCGMVHPTSRQRLLSNLTLVNSAFTAEEVRGTHGLIAKVLYPPVPGGYPNIPWAERDCDFIWVGRLHPAKRVTDVVEIIERLRTRGHRLRLTLVGTPSPGQAAYEGHLRQLARARADWLTLRCWVPRHELVEIVARHRYALHTMIDEPFGIVVGEYLRAGCIPFVHASGGPAEIVGDDPRLLFHSSGEAEEKISTVLNNPTQQAALHAVLEPRRALFTEEKFMRDLRAIIEEFASGLG